VRYVLPLVMIMLVGIAAMLWLLSAGTQGGIQCSEHVVIVRGRANQPMECVCINGALASCFSPGP
jgi:hypothetical protein